MYTVSKERAFSLIRNGREKKETRRRRRERDKKRKQETQRQTTHTRVRKHIDSKREKPEE